MRGANAKIGKNTRSLKSRQPLFEALEARQLLSAVVHDGVLTVRGTAGDDTISVSVVPQNSERYSASINGRKCIFRKDMVKMIHVYGGRGDDRIDVRQSFGRITARMTVDGGKGRNVITGLPQTKPTTARVAAEFALAGEIRSDSGDVPAYGPVAVAKSTPPMVAAQPASSGTGSTPTRVAQGDPITDTRGNPITAGESGNVVTPPLGGTEEGNGGSTQLPGNSARRLAVFDGLLLRNKPNLSATGLLPIYVTGDEFWSGEWPNYDMTKPDESRVRALARRVSALGQKLVIDIEHWPVDMRSASDADVQATVDKFAAIIAWAHDESPNLEIGIYSVLPLPDSVITKGTVAEIAAWQAANDRLASLAAKVDFLAPSLYAYSDDPLAWVTFAKAEISLARRYGKPVYPFVCPYYMESADPPAIQMQNIPDNYWRLQLTIMQELADGVVLWGGWQEQWAATDAWWKIARDQATENLPNATAVQPAAPTGLVATAEPGHVDLTWNDAAGDAKGFIVERSDDGQNFTAMAVVDSGTRTYSDSRIRGRVYYYRIRASNWVTESNDSNVVSVRSRLDAFARIEAENVAAGLDYTVNSKIAGGYHGRWGNYGLVDFGSGASSITALVAVPYTGQTIELRLDSATGPLIGTLLVAATPSWDTFTQQATVISRVAGIHELYLVFPTDHGAAVDWFRFAP